MKTATVTALIICAVLEGGVAAKADIRPPTLAEMIKYKQAGLDKAKGKSFKSWYGGQNTTLIPQNAVASVSNLSCARMPKYEAPRVPYTMWLCDYDFAINVGQDVVFKTRDQQQLSQDMKSRNLEIPPPQIALPK